MAGGLVHRKIESRVARPGRHFVDLSFCVACRVVVMCAMFVWSKLSASKWIDAWEERFAGNPNLVIEILKGGKTLRVQVYCGSEKEGKAIIARFGGTVRKVAKEEWTNPAQARPPIKVRGALVISTAGDAKTLDALQKDHPGRHIISVPAEMAFGTGDHATTATCLRMLADIARERGEGWSVADLGCGTGLLCIAAKKLGAGKAYACDFDPFAVQVTRRNLARNHTEEVLVEERDVLKWKPRVKYDVVVANLFSTVLLEAFPVLAKLLKPGGDLVISGILASQGWEVLSAGAGHGFGFSKVVTKGKWVTARGAWMDEMTEG
jgi:ribosomal protein L11 methyltransferase